jgi:hypothetical protein
MWQLLLYSMRWSSLWASKKEKAGAESRKADFPPLRFLKRCNISFPRFPLLLSPRLLILGYTWKMLSKREMKGTMKKAILSAMLCLFLLLTFAGASEITAFPAAQTAADGTINWSYYSNAGTALSDAKYSYAGTFNEQGLAEVRDFSGQTAIVDQTGALVVDWQPSPKSLEQKNGVIAFRYAEETVYFNQNGEQVGRVTGASGFPSDDRVAFEENGLWGYRTMDDQVALVPQYTAAGDFQSGRALVTLPNGACQLIDPDGEELFALPIGAVPSTLEIYKNDVIILQNGVKYALYSLAEQRFMTGYAYDEILPFDNSCAMIRQGTLWGLLSTWGNEMVTPTYPYLTYMGEGIYAARGVDAGASAISETGQTIYRTESYDGGFETFVCGLSWHGTPDGGLVFFNDLGTLSRTIENANDPVILSSTVVRISRDNNETSYVNIWNGETVYEPVRSYTLSNGASVSGERYEKWLGLRDDGSDYGWDITYPQLSGMADRTLQTKINNAIRDFFLSGPAAGQREALSGSYGLSEEGNVLVVWANCESGPADQAVLWNESIAINLTTGDAYTVFGDLLNDSAVSMLTTILPQTAPYCGSPRMSATGVTFYRNYAASNGAAAYSEAYLLDFDQLAAVLNVDGACYRALTGFTGKVFSDVPSGHWAFRYVTTVSSAGLMQGDENGFRPSDALLVGEACVTIARALNLPTGVMKSIDPNAWYAPEVGGLYEAGLLQDFPDVWFDPDQPITRQDAMQLLANALRYQGREGEISEASTESYLSRFPDSAQIAPSRREAVAVCIRAGIIQGDENGLRPLDSFTRAEFSKLLCSILGA